MLHLKKNTFLLIIKMSMPYIFILLIPFLVLFKVYYSSLDHAFKIEKDRNILTLEQSCEYIDTQLTSFSELSNYIAYNQDIISLLNLYHPLANNKDFFYMYEFCQSTPNYKLINPSIEDIYIFLGDLDYVIELPTAYRLQDFLRANNYSLEIFREEFLSLNYYNEVLITPDSNLTSSPDVLFVSSLPYGISENINNQLVIKLNTHLFFNRLNNISLGDKGAIFVLDPSNNVILSKFGPDSAITLSDLSYNAAKSFSLSSEFAKDYTISQVTSAYNAWTYISIIPNELIISQVNYIKTTILTLILFALIITFLLCTLLGLRKGLFLMNIFSNLSPSQDTLSLPDHPYKCIEQGISLLRSQNDMLTHMVYKQSELLSTSIIKDILYGTYESPTKLVQTIQSLDIDLDSPFYCTVIFKISNVPHSTSLTPYSLLTKSFLTSILEESCSFKHYYSDIDTIHMAILFLLPASTTAPTKLIQDLNQVTDTLKSKHQLEVILAHSSCYSNLIDVKESFIEASNLSEYATYLGLSGIILPDKLPASSSTVFYYPLTLELDLIQSLHARDRSKLETLLDELYRINFKERTLSLEMIKQFTHSLRHTLLHALSSILDQPSSPLYQEACSLATKLECMLSISVLYDYVLDTYRIICGDSSVKRNSLNEQLIDDIKIMIENAYQDSNFNLSILADQCQLNENTLYKNFKDWFGMTFSDYLENYRIEVACKLLSQKQTSIKDITILVGYNSDYSFRRAFKRCMGVPPSKYTDAS